MMNDLLSERKESTAENTESPDGSFLPISSYLSESESSFVAIYLSDKEESINCFMGFVRGEDAWYVLLQEIDSYGCLDSLTYIKKKQIIRMERNTVPLARRELLFKKNMSLR